MEEIDWPGYYRGGSMWFVDVVDAFGLDFYEGSVLRYLLRWRRKQERGTPAALDDLRKARSLLDKMISYEETGSRHVATIQNLSLPSGSR
jgi:hypothetical protein